MRADNRRLNVIHRSLTQPVLVMGAERRLALALWVVCLALVLPPKGWLAAGAAALLATVGHGALVYLAKLDPQFSEVYVRHFRYRQDHYPARTSIWCLPPSRGPIIMGCWVVAAIAGVVAWIEFGHPKIVFTLGALGAAYGTWKLMSASDIHPTIP
jgi:type IV secretion system protein TrbD